VPRIIITTCGISLLTSNCWTEDGYEISKKPALLEFSVERLEDKVEHEILYRNYINSKKPDAQCLASKFDETVWAHSEQIRKLPAELASLKAIDIYCTNKNMPLSTDDKLLLLYADNDDAEFCAKTIYHILKGKNLLKISIDDVERTKIINLKPDRIDLFRKSIEDLWYSICNDYVLKDNIKYFFNLTGGYKSLIILLACLAYAKGMTDSHIFYLNEESGTEMLTMSFHTPHIDGRCKTIKSGYIELSTKRVIEPLTPVEI
jgi:hypothetical protein